MLPFTDRERGGREGGREGGTDRRRYTDRDEEGELERECVL